MNYYVFNRFSKQKYEDYIILYILKSSFISVFIQVRICYPSSFFLYIIEEIYWTNIIIGDEAEI